MGYKDKARWNEWNARRRERNAKHFRELMESTPCTDCGNLYPYYVMEWDHVPERGKKKTNISTMIAGRCYDAPSLIEELAKCDLVCANCHKIRTHKRRTIT